MENIPCVGGCHVQWYALPRKVGPESDPTRRERTTFTTPLPQQARETRRGTWRAHERAHTRRHGSHWQRPSTTGPDKDRLLREGQGGTNGAVRAA